MVSESKIVVDKFPDDDKNADEWAPYIVVWGEDEFGNRVALLETSENKKKRGRRR